MAASTTILLYLLKANGALLLVAAAYFGLLRRLTFFTLNRAYLVLALLFAALYPALPVPALLPAEATPAVFFPVVGSAEAPITTTVLSAPAVDWAAVGVALYAVGAAVVLARLLLQLLALARLRWRSRPALVQGHTVRVLAGEISPFSFGRSIYLNPDQHPGPELAAVLRHERVHVRQWHTLDVLLAQLALAAAWCNPAAWLLRRALLENLEFLADAAVLETGLDRRAYQYSLLRLSHAPAGPSLVSHFTFPTLKNRVVMMNTPLSSSGQLARYFVAGPLVLAVALGISGARAQSGGPMGPAAAKAMQSGNADETNSAYCLDGRLVSRNTLMSQAPETVATLKVLRGAQVQQVLGNAVVANRAMVITTLPNQHRADVVAFNRKVDAAGAQDTHFKIGPKMDSATHKLPDGVKAYIAKKYPGSTIGTYTTANHAAPKPPYVKYYASVTDNNSEKHELYFNDRQEPVAVPNQIAPAAADKSAPLAPGLGNSYYHYGRPTPVVYLDGQRYAGDMNSIDPKSIGNISMFKGEKARRRFGTGANEAVVVVTTSAKQNDADVRAFNERVGAGVEKPTAPTATPAPAVASVPYLAAPALAYITQHYPGARLLGVAAVPAPDGGPTRYQAQIVLGRRPGYLLFDAAGQFISDSYSSSVK